MNIIFKGDLVKIKGKIYNIVESSQDNKWKDICKAVENRLNKKGKAK